MSCSSHWGYSTRYTDVAIKQFHEWLVTEGLSSTDPKVRYLAEEVLDGEHWPDPVVATKGADATLFIQWFTSRVNIPHTECSLYKVSPAWNEWRGYATNTPISGAEVAQRRELLIPFQEARMTPTIFDLVIKVGSL